MTIDGQIASGLLPTDDAEWSPVVGGESGATVLHDHEAARYAKVVPAAAAQDLAAERERITWLGEAGLPVAAVLDWRVTDDGACLITSAVAGVSADQLDAVALRRAWPSIAEIIRTLHGLPVEKCPFDRGLGAMMPLAREVVAAGRVQTEFLPVELQQVPPAMILDGIEDELPRRTVQERSSPVVCHGDLCLPNILVAPDTMRVSGLIDLGGSVVRTRTLILPCCWRTLVKRGVMRPPLPRPIVSSPSCTGSVSTPSVGASICASTH